MIYLTHPEITVQILDGPVHPDLEKRMKKKARTQGKSNYFAKFKPSDIRLPTPPEDQTLLIPTTTSRNVRQSKAKKSV